jgi:hypothetical protein
VCWIPAATVTGTPLDRVPDKRTARSSQNRKIVMAITVRIRTQIRRWEHDERSIPPWICRLAWVYGRHGLPKEYASMGSNP